MQIKPFCNTLRIGFYGFIIGSLTYKIGKHVYNGLNHRPNIKDFLNTGGYLGAMFGLYVGYTTPKKYYTP